MNSFAWDKKKNPKQKHTQRTLQTASHCCLMTPVKLIRSFSIHDYIWTGMHTRGCQCEKRGMSLSRRGDRVRRHIFFFYFKNKTRPDVRSSFVVRRDSYWWRGRRCWGCRPSGTGWSGWTAETGPASCRCRSRWWSTTATELKSRTQTHVIAQDIYVWKIYTIDC